MNKNEIQPIEEIEIVDTQYNGRANNHRNLVLHQELLMKHMKNNFYDQNAVMIFTSDLKELGFLPKGYASIYAPAIDSNRYAFTVKVIKTEYEAKRPILIVEIISEFNHRSEEEIERAILEFVQNVVNGYEKLKKEYLDFICAESVVLDEVIASLNQIRLIGKIYSLSENIIKQHQIQQNHGAFIAYTKEELIQIIDEIKLDISDILKKIQKTYNEFFNIADKEEYFRVQCEIYEKRNKFCFYDELFSAYREAIEHYAVIDFVSANSSPQTNEPNFYSTEYEIAEEDEPLISETAVEQVSDLTEKTFFSWLISDGKVAEVTAGQYISNIHSLEKIYQNTFGISENILGANSAEEAKSIIEKLVVRNEYINANKRRHNSFRAALTKFTLFAGIIVDELNFPKKKRRSQVSYNTEPNVIKIVNFETPDEYVYHKPCSFTLNGEYYHVKNWKKLYKTFLKLLYQNSTYTELLKKMIGKPLCGRQIDFADQNDTFKLREPIRIGFDFFAEGNLSGIQIIRNIKHIMELCSIDDEHMKIECYLKQKNCSL